MNFQIAPKALAQKLRSAQPPRLLDVRQPDEFALVSLPGAVLIPLNELPQRVDEIADWKDQEVVVYCHHGIRSLQAIAQLKHFGFTNLLNLAGGIDRWATDVDPAARRY